MPRIDEPRGDLTMNEPALKADPRLIEELRDLLVSLQYDAVQRGLRDDYYERPFPQLEPFREAIADLPERHRLSFEALLLGQPVRTGLLRRAWGRDLVDGLLDTGLLEGTAGGKVRTTNYGLVSYLGRFFLVSLNPYYPGSRDPDASIYVGGDSLTLAAHLPYGRRFERVLDLCAGSGIQGILLAPVAGEVVSVELNAEAVQAARFNGALNGVQDRLRVRRGDLYDPLANGRFDLIVANPPFIPVPAGVPFSGVGAGGEDGLDVLRPLLEGLPARLAEGGEALVYAEGVGDAEGPFVRDVVSQLAEAEDIGGQFILTSRLSVKSALILRAMSLSKLRPDPRAELAAWRDLYERLGASHVYNFVLRLEHGRGTTGQVVAFDPRREERGIAVNPGLVVKPV